MFTVPYRDSPETLIARRAALMRCKRAGLLVPLVVPARFGTPAIEWLPSNWLALYSGASLFLFRLEIVGAFAMIGDVEPFALLVAGPAQRDQEPDRCKA